MATTPPRTRLSERLFSEVVREADASGGEKIPPRDPGYEFTNGRKFVTPRDPYAANGP